MLDKGQVVATSAGPHQIPFEIKNSRHSAAYTLLVVVTYVPGPPPAAAAPVVENKEPEVDPVDELSEALTAEVSEVKSPADQARQERERKEAAEQLVALLEAGAEEVEVIVLTADESAR